MALILLDSVIEPTVPRDVFYWTAGIGVALIGYLASLVWNRAQSRSDLDSAKIEQINQNMTLVLERTQKIDKIEKDVQALRRWQGIVNDRLKINNDDEEEDNNE